MDTISNLHICPARVILDTDFPACIKFGYGFANGSHFGIRICIFEAVLDTNSEIRICICELVLDTNSELRIRTSESVLDTNSELRIHVCESVLDTNLNT